MPFICFNQSYGLSVPCCLVKSHAVEKEKLIAPSCRLFVMKAVCVLGFGAHECNGVLSSGLVPGRRISSEILVTSRYIVTSCKCEFMGEIVWATGYANNSHFWSEEIIRSKN